MAGGRQIMIRGETRGHPGGREAPITSLRIFTPHTLLFHSLNLNQMEAVKQSHARQSMILFLHDPPFTPIILPHQSNDLASFSSFARTFEVISPIADLPSSSTVTGRSQEFRSGLGSPHFGKQAVLRSFYRLQYLLDPC